MQNQSKEIDGVKMRWEAQGSGDPVVLIHGIPTSPALWRDVMPRITGRRVLAWEMPGYGDSIPEGEGRDISISAQADYLAAWLRDQGLSRVPIAAHDLGGGVAQIAAVRHPELVGGLLLTNAICYDSWPVPLISAVAKAGSIAKHAPDGSLHALLKMIYSKGHAREEAAEAAYDTHAPYYDHHGGAEAFVRQAQSLDPADTEAIASALPRLGIPARVVWGAADEFQKISYGERLAADLAAPLRRIEGGLHFTPEDHPAVIAEEINLLLRDCAGAEARTGARAGAQ